uniref:Ferredoxin thioredoxin reductase alpha chain domain-containing protein n=1 Tax=Fagus sylvatica TaxID=28930 RepID=A0A2N9GEA3_FAGSY
MTTSISITTPPPSTATISCCSSSCNISMMKKPPMTSSSSSSSAMSFSFSPRITPTVTVLPHLRRSRMISCEVALKSDSTTSSSSLSSDDVKIGARVRVKVALKVHHVPKVAEVDLTGMEGELKQYVGEWKGKRISANLPYKVQFVTHIEGRGPVKFFAHLKEDEFEYL